MYWQTYPLPPLPSAMKCVGGGYNPHPLSKVNQQKTLGRDLKTRTHKIECHKSI